MNASRPPPTSTTAWSSSRVEVRVPERGQEAARDRDRRSCGRRCRGRAGSRSCPSSGSGQLRRERRRRASEDIVFPERDVHEVPEDVEQRDVRLLDAVDAEARHHEAVIGAASASGRRPCPRRRWSAAPSSRARSSAVDEIRRLAAGAERQRHVAGRAPAARSWSAKTLAKSRSLPMAVSSAASAGQRDRRQRPALLDDRVDELDRHVLRVAGAAAVAHDVEPPARSNARRHRPGERLDTIRLRPEELLLDVGALARLAEDGVFHGTATGSPRCRPYA